MSGNTNPWLDMNTHRDTRAGGHALKLYMLPLLLGAYHASAASAETALFGPRGGWTPGRRCGASLHSLPRDVLPGPFFASNQTQSFMARDAKRAGAIKDKIHEG